MFLNLIQFTVKNARTYASIVKIKIKIAYSKTLVEIGKENLPETGDEIITIIDIQFILSILRTKTNQGKLSPPPPKNL